VSEGVTQTATWKAPSHDPTLTLSVRIRPGNRAQGGLSGGGGRLSAAQSTQQLGELNRWRTVHDGDVPRICGPLAILR